METIVSERTSPARIGDDRHMSNALTRRLMQAIEEVIGITGLNMVLRRCGLERFNGNLPSDDQQQTVLASEYAALHQAIEDYYGRGARGALMRIGRSVYRRTLADHPLRARLEWMLLRFMPVEQRAGRVLQQLARRLAGPDGAVRLEQAGAKFVLVDESSFATLGRVAESEVCWVTVGAIQEALQIATGREPDIDEVACRACGAPACRFEITPT